MASSGSDRSLPQPRAVPPAAVRLGSSKSGRIAIVSPHRRFGGPATRHLDSSFVVSTVVFSRTLLDDLADLSPDVVILEHVKSAGIDLVRVCRDLSDSLSARIIVVSDDDEHEDQSVHIAALDSGADDFLTASVSAPMFMARVRVALRRRPSASTRPDLIRLGDLTLDIEAHALYLAGELTKCPPLQFTLLTALGQAPNRVLDRATLADAAWRDLPEGLQSRRLRVAISVLRHILGAGPQRPRVESVANVGYRLVVETGAAGTTEMVRGTPAVVPS